MTEVKFTYQGVLTSIQGDENVKFTDICKRFSIKVGKDINTIYFLYNGIKLNINEDLKVKDINKGKDINEINILVHDNLNTEIKNEKKIILSKEIICPICKENNIINFYNYRIFFLQCKNNDKKINSWFSCSFVH